MKKSLLLLLLITAIFSLSGAEVFVAKPGIIITGQRVRPQKRIVRSGKDGKTSVVTTDNISERRYRFIFAVRNTGKRILALSTAFTGINFIPDREKNGYVLRLSHRRFSARVKDGNKNIVFPVIHPDETFKIVKLRPGEGTMISVDCWIPADKLRNGDKVAVEYAPDDLGRYDFHKCQVRSESVEYRFTPRKAEKTPDAVLI